MKQPRLLKAEEIEIRIGNFNKAGTGASFLLYKDARVDMNILDETYGVDGWQRTHEVINGNLFCNIDIWDEEKKRWIRKQDVGVESNAQKEKGEASDAFKRAGFNVGIGRELYTKIFIWINLDKNEIEEKQGGKKALSYKVKFHVKSIEYDDNRNIVKLSIADNNGKTRFQFGMARNQQPKPESKPNITKTQAKALETLIKNTNTDMGKILGYYKVNSLNDLNTEQFTEVSKRLDKKR